MVLLPAAAGLLVVITVGVVTGLVVAMVMVVVMVVVMIVMMVVLVVLGVIVVMVGSSGGFGVEVRDLGEERRLREAWRRGRD